MKTLFSLLLLLSCLPLYSQKQRGKVSLYVFDKDWKGSRPEEARYLLHLEEFSDTSYEFRYYNYEGPMITLETYKDKNGKIPHGDFIYYNKQGQMDSSGCFVNGKKHDWWYHYTDSFTVWKKEKYHMGTLVLQMDRAAIEAEREEKKDTQQHFDESEAVFKGGDNEWMRYIQKNIQYPNRASKLEKSGQLVIQFVVNTNGTTGEFKILRSIEYSLDEEAIRIIRNSPKWRPAHQDGKLVKAYRIQPLVFQVPR